LELSGGSARIQDSGSQCSGSKALYRAVREVFGQRALIQRCQEHKKRNVPDALPQS
jgi:hypothetical protein